MKRFLLIAIACVAMAGATLACEHDKEGMAPEGTSASAPVVSSGSVGGAVPVTGDVNAAPPVTASATCGDYSVLVGKPMKDVQLSAIKGKVRVLHPNDAMTMDFSPDRLNLILDDKDVITEARCG
ncbi:MAG: hypothetical protein KGQ41_08440 [Alphaproteobacteria bacterium]|nr:hypothetical protein [Alphaproteobacteria bacterium]